jgi:hypothetical protein
MIDLKSRRKFAVKVRNLKPKKEVEGLAVAAEKEPSARDSSPHNRGSSSLEDFVRSVAGFGPSILRRTLRSGSRITN